MLYGTADVSAVPSYIRKQAAGLIAYLSGRITHEA